MVDLSAKDHDIQQLNQVVCPFCKRRFKTDEDLTLHVVTRHTPAESGQAAVSGSGNTH